ncbi:C40 family peptidase [Streptomyces sp. NPDC087850]|uniref:C40 family peptidase n=1 Tax=Streptomyces sp. NPDC087850 TaxID=3365809 RepID=UPI003827D77E
MSHTAQIPSHRKPRRSAPKVTILRAGVAGGVLSTIAVAAAAGPANAEPVTQTIEMPTLTSGLAGDFAKSADATQRVATNLDLQAQEDAAIAKAAKVAKTAKAEAERTAEAEKKKAQAAERAAAAERATRDAERTALAAVSTNSASNSNSTAGSGAGSNASTGSSSASTVTSRATGSAASVVAFVQSHIGDAYIMGSTGPNAWDCSGLVQAAYSQIGIDLPRVSQDQSTAGTQVSLSNLQPGDILYWGGAGSAYHTAIYIGDGQFVGAQNPSKGVVQASLDYDPPSGAVRVL